MKNKNGRKDSGRNNDAPYVEWMKDYHSGDPEKKQMAVANMCLMLEKWVHCHAKKFHTYVCDEDDLFQVGMLAIIRNMARYNPTRFVPITYFTSYIHGAMYDYVTSQYGLKRNDMTNKNKIERAIKQLEEMGKPVTIENIVRMTDERITREVIYNNRAVFRASSEQVRIDKDTDNDYSILDGFAQNTETPERAYEEKEKREVVAEALGKLTPEERAVMRSLYFEEKTVAETMSRLALTSSQVKKFRTSAFIKLQNSTVLTNYLNINISVPAHDSENFFYGDDVDIIRELGGMEIDFDGSGI